MKNWSESCCDEINQKIIDLETDLIHQENLTNIFEVYLTDLTEIQHKTIAKEVTNIKSRQENLLSEIEKMKKNLKTIKTHEKNILKRSRLIIAGMLLGIGVSTVIIIAISLNKLDSLIFAFLPLVILIFSEIVVMTFVELNTSEKSKKLIYVILVLVISVFTVIILQSPIAGIVIYVISIASLASNLLNITKWSKKIKNE